jgi:hypothetical protein
MNRAVQPVLTLGLACALSAPAAAQSTWLDREHRTSVLTEIYFPRLEGADRDFPTWTWFAAGRFPISRASALVLELPYTRGEYEHAGLPAQSAIGNPYIGIEVAPHASGARFEAGFRPSVMTEDFGVAAATGAFTDIEREEAFVPNLWVIRVAVHAHHAASATSPISWDIRFAPAAWITSSNRYGSGDDNEFIFGYGGWLRYEARDARAGAGFGGWWDATNGGGDFGSTSVHQLDFAADFLHGTVRPGVQLKVPLDHDLADTVDPAFGLSVMILPGL